MSTVFLYKIMFSICPAVLYVQSFQDNANKVKKIHVWTKKVLFSGTCFPSKLSAKLIFGRSLNFSKNLVLWNLILRNSSRHWKLSGCWFSTSFNRTCAPSPDWLLKIHSFNNDWSFGNFLYCWIAWRSPVLSGEDKKNTKKGKAVLFQV